MFIIPFLFGFYNIDKLEEGNNILLFKFAPHKNTVGRSRQMNSDFSF